MRRFLHFDVARVFASSLEKLLLHDSEVRPQVLTYLFSCAEHHVVYVLLLCAGVIEGLLEAINFVDLFSFQ